MKMHLESVDLELAGTLGVTIMKFLVFDDVGEIDCGGSNACGPEAGGA